MRPFLISGFTLLAVGIVAIFSTNDYSNATIPTSLDESTSSGTSTSLDDGSSSGHLRARSSKDALGVTSYRAYTTSGPLESGAPYWLDDGTEVVPFLGIPFAAPPVGPLRWRPPQPPQPWGDKPRKADTFGPKCTQPPGHRGEDSEDCLYLNIHTPAEVLQGQQSQGWASKDSSSASSTPLPLLPVVVYIHGGGLLMGSGREGLDTLVGREGGLVEVSLQYRLNMLGFLAIEELSQEQGGVSGNYGIMDQLLALRWVQENVANFGGDPTKVTIMGQSSGGTSVMALLSSPQSVGLFQGAISLSGSPNITMGLRQGEVQNRHLVEQLGCGESMYANAVNRVACLRGLSVEQVVSVIPQVWWADAQNGIPHDRGGNHQEGVLLVDGVTLTKSFPQALAQALVDVPLVMGNMGYEPDEYRQEDVSGYSQEAWHDFLRTSFLPWGDNAWETVLSHYEGESKEDPQKAYDAISTDVSLTCASIHLARQAALQGQRTSPIYLFMNRWHMGIESLDQRPYHYARHSWDIQAATANWPEGLEPTPYDHRLTEELRSMWSHFIVYGKPPPSTHWEPAFPTNGPAPPVVGDYSIFLHQAQGSTPVVNFKAGTCRMYLEDMGIGQDFWWCN